MARRILQRYAQLPERAKSSSAAAAANANWDALELSKIVSVGKIAKYYVFGGISTRRLASRGRRRDSPTFEHGIPTANSTIADDTLFVVF